MKKALEQIRKMVGQTYMYNKENYTITGFIPEDRGIRLITDGKDIFLLEDDLPHRLDLFLEVEVSDSERQTLMATKGTSSIQDLKNVLLDNIKKVQENKDYVPQAAQICKSVTAFTNLAKAELEYIKMMQRP